MQSELDIGLVLLRAHRLLGETDKYRNNYNSVRQSVYKTEMNVRTVPCAFSDAKEMPGNKTGQFLVFLEPKF